MRAPTLRDVAREAGVHPATVSRALNPSTRKLVNDATAERVARVAAALGYRPNPIARSLKTARSTSIGMIIPDLTNPLFPPIVRGIEDVLAPAGYNAWLANTDNDPDRAAAHVESMRSRHVEGLIIATALLEDPLLDKLAAEDLPMVLINRRLARTDVPTVTSDDATGVALAVSHLAELGHRRIVHLAGPQTVSTGVTRLRSFRQAVHEHGLDDDPRLIVRCSAFSVAEGARAMREILDEGVEFTAVFAGNDMQAVGVYDVLQERGLRCPEDISVVGFNDTPFFDKLRPPLTTIHIPHYDIGAEAARMLLEELRDPTRSARSVLLPLTLVRRESTAPPRRKASAARRTRRAKA
ncbi:MAG TPA: LacI family DNA-binding transcriptional regulator [Actinomycetes bacterium]|nr:LacI family DNA-binding transcriptional regulator [Actinomycetes bacterium]